MQAIGQSKPYTDEADTNEKIERWEVSTVISSLCPIFITSLEGINESVKDIAIQSTFS